MAYQLIKSIALDPDGDFDPPKQDEEPCDILAYILVDKFGVGFETIERSNNHLSYEEDSHITYQLEDHIPSELRKDGWLFFEAVSVTYYPGDWNSDGDSEYHVLSVRRATDEDMHRFGYKKQKLRISFMRERPNQRWKQ